MEKLSHYYLQMRGRSETKVIRCEINLGYILEFPIRSNFLWIMKCAERRQKSQNVCNSVHCALKTDYQIDQTCRTKRAAVPGGGRNHLDSLQQFLKAHTSKCLGCATVWTHTLSLSSHKYVLLEYLTLMTFCRSVWYFCGFLSPPTMMHLVSIPFTLA